MDEIKNIKTSIPRDRLGYPGIASELVVVTSQDETDNRAKMLDTSERPFELTAVLSRQHTVPDEIDFNTATDSGTSYIKLLGGKLKATLQNKATFEFNVNDRNLASVIHFNCTAKSKDDALNQFHKAVGPSLDHFSYLGNVPIAIQKIVGFDKKHGVTFATYTAPYPEIQINPGTTGIPKDMLPIYALFREAKNSNSPYYKFLCFTKILEGIFRYIRPRCRELAKKHNVSLTTEKEIVPNHPELAMFYQKEMIGKPIQKLYEEKLQKRFRDALAHFALDNSDPWILSDHLVNAEVINNLLLVELCCRTIIKTETSCFEQLVAAGANV